MKANPVKLNPAAKVAAGATAVIAVLYVIGVIVFNVLFASHQTAQSDYYLATRLTAAGHDPAMLSQSAVATGSSAAGGDVDADSAPVFLWLVNAAGTVTAHRPGAPALPAGLFAAHPPHDGLAFTSTELGILEILMRRSPGVADRRSIAQHVWDNEADAFGSNTIDVHLARLRSKLAGAGVRIETVRGVGYRISPA